MVNLVSDYFLTTPSHEITKSTKLKRWKTMPASKNMKVPLYYRDNNWDLWSIPLKMKVPQIGTNCFVMSLITSCDAIPPMRAATARSSAAPKRHISLIKSLVKVKPLQPKLLSKPKAVVFDQDILSSICPSNWPGKVL